MGRLTIDMTDHQHQNLKAMAALQGKTIKQFALERLLPADSHDAAAWQELKDMLGKRVEEGLSGRLSNKSLGTIVEEELDRGSRG